MVRFRFRWADEDELVDGIDIYEAFNKLEEKYRGLPLDTTFQIDLIKEGTS